MRITNKGTIKIGENARFVLPHRWSPLINHGHIDGSGSIELTTPDSVIINDGGSIQIGSIFGHPNALIHQPNNGSIELLGWSTDISGNQTISQLPTY